MSNGGCGPNDTLYLSGDAAEDRPKLEKFLSHFHDAGDFALPLSPALVSCPCAVPLCPDLVPCPCALPLCPALVPSLALGTLPCPHALTCPHDLAFPIILSCNFDCPHVQPDLESCPGLRLCPALMSCLTYPALSPPASVLPLLLHFACADQTAPMLS